MKKIYLAAPYTYTGKFKWLIGWIVRRWRFWEVNKKAAELMMQGYCVFSPISMTHPIAIVKRLPGHWEFWEKQDLPFIEWCDEFHILCLWGWQKSSGIKTELSRAHLLNKKVVCHDYN